LKTEDLTEKNQTKWHYGVKVSNKCVRYC